MFKTIKKLSYSLAVALPLLSSIAYADDLNIGVRAGPEALDPHYLALGSNIAAIKNIYEALVFQDANLQIKPGLAEKWESVNDTTWRFHLRPNVTFQNGEKLTADDVKFSLDRVKTAAGPDGGLVINTRNIDKVVVEDPLTLTIHTSIANPSLPQDLARIVILPKSIGNASIEDFNTGKAAIGTGPFMFSSFQPRNALVVKKNPNYWGGDVPWDQVTFTEISNDAARVAALMSNRVDLINYVPYADVEKIRRDKQKQIIQGNSIYIFLIYPDVRAKTEDITDKKGKPFDVNPLSKKDVREALSLAVDRSTISRIVLEGFAKPANQINDDNFFGSIKDPKPLEFNQKKAKELLAKAGYPDGFRMSLYCTNDRLPGDGATCSALGQMFARIGIDTKVNALSRTVFVPAKARSEYMINMAGWGSVTGEAAYTISSIGHTNDPKKGLGAFNNTSVSDPEVDKLIEEGMQTIDDTKRQELFETATQKILDEKYLIPVVQLSTVWASKANLLDFQPRVDEETLPYYMKPVAK